MGCHHCSARFMQGICGEFNAVVLVQVFHGLLDQRDIAIGIVWDHLNPFHMILWVHNAETVFSKLLPKGSSVFSPDIQSDFHGFHHGYGVLWFIPLEKSSSRHRLT